MNVADYIILALLLGVLGVLIAGIVNMARGKNPEAGNRLMMWRVALQGAAILLAAVFLAKG